MQLRYVQYEILEREKYLPQHGPIKETIKYVLWSVFSKVISCIQISIEKPYQSNFVQPSIQTGMKETMIKDFSPLTRTYEEMALHVSIKSQQNRTSTKQW